LLLDEIENIVENLIEARRYEGIGKNYRVSKVKSYLIFLTRLKTKTLKLCGFYTKEWVLKTG